MLASLRGREVQQQRAFGELQSAGSDRGADAFARLASFGLAQAEDGHGAEDATQQAHLDLDRLGRQTQQAGAACDRDLILRFGGDRFDFHDRETGGAVTGHGHFRAEYNAPADAKEPQESSCMADAYYRRRDLERFGEVGEPAPELYAAYEKWSQAVFKEGHLSRKVKHLIAAAVSHALQCPYCIDAHTKSAHGAGATREELAEAIHAASVIRGGATLVHGIQALDALDEDDG